MNYSDFLASKRLVAAPAGFEPGHIPPALRPRLSALTRYFILFEVEKWEAYPADPFLLKHIAGPFYAVESEWELTQLEVSLLSTLA